MIFAADRGPHSGRATPSLRDARDRHLGKTTGRPSTYLSPIPVQTNPATSHELEDFRILARSYAHLSEGQITRLLEDNDLLEICHGDEK